MGRLLEQLHQLGSELSTSSTLISLPDELLELAQRSPDQSPHRSDEPYRRVIAGFYARLAATAQQLDQYEALRHAVANAPPYGCAEEFLADLNVIHRSLLSHGARLLARGRLRRLRRTVAIFGFHLAPIDLRQNSEVHERTIAELLAAVGRCKNYLELSEDQRIELLCAELADPRPLRASGVNYSQETRGELDIFDMARSIQQRYW